MGKIKNLTETTSIADTDDMVVETSPTSGNPVTKRTKTLRLWNYIRDKIKSSTEFGLTTTSKNIPGALNELNSALAVTKASLGKTSGIEVLYAYNDYVVFVLVVGTCTVAIEAWKTIQIATLPAAACPPSSLMAKGQLNYYAQINSDGKVYLGAENAQPAKYANISFCFMRNYK